MKRAWLVAPCPPKGLTDDVLVEARWCLSEARAHALARQRASERPGRNVAVFAVSAVYAADLPEAQPVRLEEAADGGA
jgi:hypothetical protein